MSGGESNPPASKAHFGVKGHMGVTSALRYKRLHWHCDRHKKRLKMIRKVGGRIGRHDNRLE
jgi:hypothetical protein